LPKYSSLLKAIQDNSRLFKPSGGGAVSASTVQPLLDIAKYR
jgi:hypothetical protein